MRRRRAARRGCGRCCVRWGCRRGWNSRSPALSRRSAMFSASWVTLVREAQGAGFVVLGVGLGEHVLPGGGVLRGDFDDRLLDRELAGLEVGTGVHGWLGFVIWSRSRTRSSGSTWPIPSSSWWFVTTTRGLL